MSVRCHFWPSDTEDFWTHYSQIGTIRRKAGKEKQHLKEGRKKRQKKNLVFDNVVAEFWHGPIF